MAKNQPLQELLAAARAPLCDWPARYPDRQAMGVLCSYVPEEMIHAARFTPVRLRGTPAPLRYADTHLPPFTCALCRSCLDQVLSGDLAFLAGTVLAHTCDAMQALADLWRMNTPESCFVDTVMQPTNLSTPAARPYLLAELGRFRQRLAGFSGQSLTDDDLWASIALYDETRRLVGRLQHLRDRLTASQFFAVLDAAQIMPREQFNPLLAGLLDDVEQASGSPAAGPRLFLAGAVLDEPYLLEMIDDLGAQVVGDDLCSGSRHFYGQVGGEGNPLAALADYSLRRLPCPAKLHPAYDPGHYLLERAREGQADGLLLIVEKFCEPHAFDSALLRPALEQAGLPYLVLEMEQASSLEALRTRLQAFVEML